MNTSCTHCRTVFRVDPRKIPETGVRARCSVCAGTWVVTRDETGAAPQVEAGGPAPPAHAAAPTIAPDAARAPAARPGGDAPPPAGAEPLPAFAGMPGTAADAGRTARFGGQDPNARAQRLARALVSDMITYHPDRHRRGLREGTLRQEFREEIRKSWEEYVEQVGRDLAHGTPYFRDALNQILSRGQPVF